MARDLSFAWRSFEFQLIRRNEWREGLALWGAEAIAPAWKPKLYRINNDEDKQA